MLNRVTTRFIALSMLIWCLAVGQARAGLWVQGTGIALEMGGTRALSSATVAYRFPQGFMLGAQAYRSSSTGTDGSAWAVGPKGGFFLNGLELTADYLPLAGDSIATGSRKGGGFAVNLGYSFEITRVIHLGIYGTYWSNTYTTRNGVDLAPRPVVKFLAPQLALGLHF